MNDKLQQALAALLNKTVSGIDAGISMLQTELPDVIQQLLMWKMASSAITVAISAVLFMAFALLYRAYKAAEPGSTLKDKDYLGATEPSIPCGVAFILLGVSCGTSLTFAIDAIYTIAQIAVAPKIYLIEYAAKLAK